MQRRKTTLRSKSGGGTAQNGNGNGNPRALVDEATYREHQNFVNWQNGSGPRPGPFWSMRYSGLSNPARPKDYPIFLRPISPVHGS